MHTHKHTEARFCRSPGEGVSRLDLILFNLGLNNSVPQFPWIRKGSKEGGEVISKALLETC